MSNRVNLQANSKKKLNYHLTLCVISNIMISQNLKEMFVIVVGVLFVVNNCSGPLRIFYKG